MTPRQSIRPVLDRMCDAMAPEAAVEVALVVVARWAVDRGAMAPETFADMAREAFAAADLDASHEATRGEEPLNRTTSAHVARSRRT